MKDGHLTELEFILVNMLIVVGPTHPYALGRTVEERGGKGFVSLGALYKALHRLEEAGFVDSEWEDVEPQEVKRPRRRRYEVTGLGERAVRQAAETRAALFPAMAPGIA